MRETSIRDYRLCYIACIDDINLYKLYFTDNFDNQWGDDWNDRPADCNAEPPYDDDSDIVTIYAEFNWLATDIIFGGKTYSVEDMNKTGIPWLIYKDKDYTDYKLMGGDKLIDVLEQFDTNKVSYYWLDNRIVNDIVGVCIKAREEKDANN